MRIRTLSAGITLVVAALLIPTRIQGGLILTDCVGFNGPISCGDPGPPPAAGIGLLTESAASPLAVPNSMTDLELADVDGDGALDVVAVAGQQYSSDPSVVAVMLGDGTGGFGAPITTATGAGASHLATGDVNGDGRVDVVVQSSPFPYDGSQFDVLLGAGDGTFAAAGSYAGPVTSVVRGWSRGIAIADVTGDGTPDVVMLSAVFGANSGDVWAGDGAGAFTLHQRFSWARFAGPHIIQPWALALADLNGDGALDFLTNGAGALVAYNDGTGTFAAPVDVGTPDDYVFGIGASIAGADLDGDGRQDIVYYDALQFRLTPNSASGFVSGTSLYQAVPDFAEPRSTSMAIADMDGDGHLDVIGTALGYDDTWTPEPSVSVLFGDGAGGLSNPSFYPVTQSAGEDFNWARLSIAAGDVNGDGRPDVVAANNLGQLSVLLSGSPNIVYTPFAAMDASIRIRNQNFGLKGAFLLGADSDGIDPASEAVAVSFGSVSQAIPAGSFHREVPTGSNITDQWRFQGVIGGAPVDVTIVRYGHGWFTFAWSSSDADLPSGDPITVELIIGDDIGSHIAQRR